MFTFEIDSENALVGCTLERWRPGVELAKEIENIWNRDRLYEIMDFGTYMYVPVCTEYIPVRNADNGTYLYVPVCTQFVQVLWHVWLPWSLALF